MKSTAKKHRITVTPKAPTIDDNVRGREKRGPVIIATTSYASVFDDDYKVEGETIAWSEIDGNSE